MYENEQNEREKNSNGDYFHTNENLFFDKKKKKGNLAIIQPSFQFYVIVLEKLSAVECAAAEHSKKS